MPDGDYLWRVNDHSTARVARSPVTARLDAEAYDEYGKAMIEMGRFAKPILGMAPPDPLSLDPRGLLELLRIGQRFRGMRSHDRVNQVQLLTMSAVDFLDQWFETDVLKATMSASGIIGTFLGVRSPGTAYVLLHHYMGEIDGAFRSWGLSRGGTGAVSTGHRRRRPRARRRDPHRGAGREDPDPRTAARTGWCSRTATRSRPTSWCRASIRTSRSSASSTSASCPTTSVDGVQRYKYRGSSGKVNLALDGAARLHAACPGPGAHLRGAISISPSVDYMERAYDDAKYGQFSRRPYIDMVIPSLTDPSVAPPGKHVMSCFVQYAPYHLADGTWDEQRDAFGDTVIDTIAEYAPNLKDLILHRQVLTPLDLEREFGLTEGNIFQGELSLEQLFFLRPVPGWAQYTTPVDRLYMCGSATHPGGGIMGAPGRNAAMRVLKDASR